MLLVALVSASVANTPLAAMVPGRPTISVSAPGNNAQVIDVNVVGSATDDLAVTEVEVGLWSTTLNTWFQPAGQVTPTVLSTLDTPGGTATGFSWSWPAPTDDSYRLYARSRDADGNESSWSIRRVTVGTVASAPLRCGGSVVTVDIGLGQMPTAGPDVILGTAGNDTIDGLAGDDVICGLAGNDVIDGGGDQDVLFGGPGNDTLRGDGDADALFGDSGDDVLDGGPGTDSCTPGNTGESAGDAAPQNCETIDDGSVFEWNPQEIGSGGWVTGMASHPTQANTHIARTDVGGAYRWIEADQTWEQLLDASVVQDAQQEDWNVSAVAIAASDSDRIYLATGRRFNTASGRILRSDDGGDTWVAGANLPIHGNAKHRTGGERLAVDPTDPDHLWFGSRTLGLLESFDAGLTFAAVAGVPVGTNSGDPAGVKWVLADQQGVDLVLYAGVAGEGVYTATNSGAWTQVYADATIPYDAEVAADGRLFVTSIEGGGSVTRYDPATGVVDSVTPASNRDFITIGTDPFDANRIFVGSSGLGDGRIWRSLDGGDTWSALDRDAECSQIPWLDLYDADNDFFSASSFTFDPTVQGLMWLPEGFAMRQTTDLADGEITFTCQSEGIEELVANDVIVTPGGSVITASWDRPIFVHEDGQAALQQPSTRFNSAWDLDWSPADPDFAVAVIGDHRFFNPDGVAYDSVYTLDGGDTWDRFGSFDTATHPEDLRFGNVAVSASDTSNLVRLPTFNKAVHVSDDRGDTWTEVILPGTEGVLNNNADTYAGGSHFSYFLNRKVLAADRVLPSTFYLLHEPLGLFRSDDGGTTWTLQSTTGVPSGISSFNAQLEAMPGVAERLLFTPGRLNGPTTNLYESRDGGAAWSVVPGVTNTGAFGFGAPAFAGGPASIYFDGEFDGERGIFESIDDMASWSLVVDYPLGIYQTLKTISGDQTEYGRIYVGWSGVSFAEATLGLPPQPREAGLDYTPITPCAAFDSRAGQGPSAPFDGAYGDGEIRTFDVLGAFDPGQGGGQSDCGVPASAQSVLLNLVAVSPTSSGSLAVGPAGSAPSEPVVSFAPLPQALNNSNAVVVELTGEQLDVAASCAGCSSTTEVRGVILGYFTPSLAERVQAVEDSEPPAAGAGEQLGFHSVTPCAAFDSRAAVGATGTFAGKRTAGSSTTYQITGALPAGQGPNTDCDVPSSAQAVLLNLVAVAPVGVGNLRATATGTTPSGGVVNYNATTPALNNSNAIVVPVSALGQLDVSVNCGLCALGVASTDVRGVVLGYFDNALEQQIADLEAGTAGPFDAIDGGLLYVPVAPCESFETGPFIGGATTTFAVVGTCGVPADADAVLIDLAAVDVAAAGNFRLTPAGVAPLGGVVNFGVTSPALENSNAVIVSLVNGAIDVSANCGMTCTLAMADTRGIVLGYFTDDLSLRVAALS